MSTERGQILLMIARQAIQHSLGQPRGDLPDAPWLQEPGATFVTLTQRGELRGCIGSLQAHRPLLQDVQENAVAAALHDPRFAPLTLAELAQTRIEVSLLSASEPLVFHSEQEALSLLRPGVDGVILEVGHHRGTFLPQVWEQLPDARTFMEYLKRKAGLSPQYWSEQVRLSRYTVQKWKEPLDAEEAA